MLPETHPVGPLYPFPAREISTDTTTAIYRSSLTATLSPLGDGSTSAGWLRSLSSRRGWLGLLGGGAGGGRGGSWLRVARDSGAWDVWAVAVSVSSSSTGHVELGITKTFGDSDLIFVVSEMF